MQPENENEADTLPNELQEWYYQHSESEMSNIVSVVTGGDFEKHTGGTLFLNPRGPCFRVVKLTFSAFFLALLDCVSRANAVAQSVKCVFSETVKRMPNANAKFCGKVPIHHVSRPFFRFSKF